MATNRVAGYLPPEPTGEPELPPFEVFGLWFPPDDRHDEGGWIGPGIGQEGGMVFFEDWVSASNELAEMGSTHDHKGTIVRLRVERA